MNSEPNKPAEKSLKFIHITDTHLLDHADATIHDLNPRQNLERILAHCETQYPDSDFILFTGDISQTGNWQSYCQFEAIIKPYDRPMYCVPGNHDNPEMLQKLIPTSPNQSISIINLGQCSLLLLNSWVEDQHQGRIHDTCLHQLQKHLANCHDQFNIIALHHPPVIINSQWLDNLGLQNHHEVMDIIKEHPHPSLIMSGHVHQEIDQIIDHHRILVSPSTCHQFKANSDTYCMDSSGSGYRMVQISADNTIQTQVHRLD